MNFIKGFTFKFVLDSQNFYSDEVVKSSIELLKESTAINTIVFAIQALQDHPHAERIDYNGQQMPTDEQLIEYVQYAQHLGLKVILKPMLDCRNGTWRAHINFFDIDVPCEPKWKNWFKSYTDYLLHYAKLAEKTKCEMLMIGCELVQTERKEIYWRSLIEKIRGEYSGLLTYNTDKYQEGEVKWWDALDVISSSGYYPINEWEENLKRIERVVECYQKPFFFAECGCPSRTGAANIPNDWTLEGSLNLEEQSDYYSKMFEICETKSWINGFVCWEWTSNITEETRVDDGYNVYRKPACGVIKKYYRAKA